MNNKGRQYTDQRKKDKTANNELTPIYIQTFIHVLRTGKQFLYH